MQSERLNENLHGRWGATFRIKNASLIGSVLRPKNPRWPEPRLLKKDSKIRKTFSKTAALIANVLMIIYCMEAVLNTGKKADKTSQGVSKSPLCFQQHCFRKYFPTSTQRALACPAIYFILQKALSALPQESGSFHTWPSFFSSSRLLGMLMLH